MMPFIVRRAGDMNGFSNGLEGEREGVGGERKKEEKKVG